MHKIFISISFCCFHSPTNSLPLSLCHSQFICIAYTIFYSHYLLTILYYIICYISLMYIYSMLSIFSTYLKTSWKDYNQAGFKLCITIFKYIFKDTLTIEIDKLIDKLCCQLYKYFFCNELSSINQFETMSRLTQIWNVNKPQCKLNIIAYQLLIIYLHLSPSSIYIPQFFFAKVCKLSLCCAVTFLTHWG